MKVSAVLLLLPLAACSPPLPSAAETQVALEQFYLRSHPRDADSKPFVVRCAPITYFRPLNGGAVILFGPVTAAKKATGIYVEMHRKDNDAWNLNFKGPIKNLPCEYLPVVIDGMDLVPEAGNSSER